MKHLSDTFYDVNILKCESDGIKSKLIKKQNVMSDKILKPKLFLGKAAV